MTDKQKAKLVIELLERATVVVAEFAKSLKTGGIHSVGKSADQHKVERGLEVLDHLTDLFEEGPDENWWRDFYLLTGDHMVCTNEGWIPAHMNTKKYTGYPPEEIMDEVNAPKKSRRIKK